MSTTIQAGRGERVKRDFLAEWTAGTGRTIDARIVPYGVTAEVSDGGPTYREEWVAGCFDEQITHAGRGDRLKDLKVFLNFEHRQGIGDQLGAATEIRSEPDGLHGTFEIDDGPDGDKALRFVRSGILAGISLEAVAKKSVWTDGVRRRLQAHLYNVALCRWPAFEDAVVLAVRQEPEFEPGLEIPEELRPTDMDPELVERLRAQSFELPSRYLAHPAEGTPAEAGTPEDGTRHPDTTTSEVDPTWVQRRASSGSPG